MLEARVDYQNLIQYNEGKYAHACWMKLHGKNLAAVARQAYRLLLPVPARGSLHQLPATAASFRMKSQAE
jgi:hypothetical protein